MNKLFNKTATITTSNNDKYEIKSSRYFIMPKRGKKRYKHRYGNACTITKLNPNEETLKVNDISFIGEIYSFENNRIRFLEDKYIGVNSFDTEMHDNGKELPITVIETYDDKKQTISSIGDIIEFKSDIPEQSYKLEIKILKLLLKNKEGNNKKDL